MNPAAHDARFVARRGTTASLVRGVLQSGIVRKSEWVILGFLIYAVALGAILPVAPSVRVT